ncbi:MAG: hypothetical protein RLY86_3261 [Pseudomonadota bacterium]|jgi:hypothetical protein
MVQHERTSDVLIRVLADGDDQRMTIRTFMDRLGDRGFGILILLFALPNCVPGPPGLAVITGLPVIFFAWQVMLKRPAPWLPGFIANRSFPRNDLLTVILKTQPWLRKVERLCRPRLPALMRGSAERVLGIILFILSIVLTAPIPFGNLFPAVTIAVIALAIMEQDGVLLIIGYILGLLSFLLAMAVLIFLIAVANGIIQRVAE